MNTSQQSVSHIVAKHNTMWQNNVKTLKLTDTNAGDSATKIVRMRCETTSVTGRLSNEKTFDEMHQTDLFYDCSVITDHDAKKSFTFVLPQEHSAARNNIPMKRHL